MCVFVCAHVCILFSNISHVITYDTMKYLHVLFHNSKENVSACLLHCSNSKVPSPVFPKANSVPIGKYA